MGLSGLWTRTGCLFTAIYLIESFASAQTLPKPGMPLVMQNGYATAEHLAGLQMIRDTYQEGYIAPTNLTSLKVAYLNALSNKGPAYSNVPGENPTYGNAIGLRAALVVNGQIVQLTFQGSKILTLQNQGAGLSDPVSVSIAKGAAYFIRTEVSVASANLSWPLNDLYSALPNVGSSNGTSDVLLSNSAPFDKAKGPIGFGPTAVFGQPVRGASTDLMWDHGLVMIGDSILLGPSPVPNFTAASYGYRSALGAHVPALNFGRGGEAMMDFDDPVAGRGRRQFFQAGPTLFFEFGVNDIQAHNRSVAEMEANFYNLVAAFKAAGGKRVVAVSLTPIDYGNVPRPYNPVTRVDWRNFLASLTPDSIGLDYIFVDVGPVDEEKVNSDIWWRPTTATVSPYTDDGLHPNEAGKQNIMKVIGAQLVGAFIEPFADLSTFQLSSASVKGGTTITGSLRFNVPVQRAGTISLQCDQPKLVLLPAAATVGSGQAAVTIQVATSSVGAATPVRLTASFRGVTVQTTLTLTR